MSRIESRITTVRCNRFGCETERIAVGDYVSEDEGWTDANINGEEVDLCPVHTKELAEFLSGPDHADNNADGLIPFAVNETC